MLTIVGSPRMGKARSLASYQLRQEPKGRTLSRSSFAGMLHWVLLESGPRTPSLGSCPSLRTPKFFQVRWILPRMRWSLGVRVCSGPLGRGGARRLRSLRAHQSRCCLQLLEDFTLRARRSTATFLPRRGSSPTVLLCTLSPSQYHPIR